MVNDGRIEPQLAMKVVSRFDKTIAEVLADKVKARLNFKVGDIYNTNLGVGTVHCVELSMDKSANAVVDSRVIWIPTASVTRSGPL